MSKKVNFIPATQEASDFLPSPKPAKKFYPEWLQDINVLPEHMYDVDNPKSCMPFVDSFISGYTQELICDVKISHGGRVESGMDIVRHEWFGSVRPVSTRSEDAGRATAIAKFDGYYWSEQFWYSFWEPQTPPGYSTLYFHPLNRPDLPFYTFSGIIETDDWSVGGPVPFIIKEGFEGIIPAGTPIFQFIFIKREDWTHDKKEFDKKYIEKKNFSIKKFAKYGYKKVYWKRKSYN